MSGSKFSKKIENRQEMCCLICRITNKKEKIQNGITYIMTIKFVFCITDSFPYLCKVETNL